jgi:Uma2 family endonuclease
VEVNMKNLKYTDEYMTYEGFLEYIKSENRFRLEYDNGYIYYMTPVHPNHERVKQRIQISLINFIGLNSKCEVFTSEVAARFMPQEGEIYNFEPDIMMCCEPDKFDNAIYKGIPALIVEILSHSTEERDLNLKLDVYERCGVPEYWIVDRNSRTVNIYKNNVDGVYKQRLILNENETITCDNGFSLDIKYIFEGLK